MMANKNPWADRDRIARLEARLQKTKPYDADHAKSRVRTHLRAAQALGHPIVPPMRVLEVGCGTGDTVRALVNQGFDASGIDVLELWGRDFGIYWQNQERPSGSHIARLHRVDCDQYRLPFDDGYFDFAFSDQVFEHVFNYEQVFSEIARVLKPGAISCHEFGGLNTLLEGHINVPITALCRFRSYLAIWARFGRRSSRQSGFGWRETLDCNLETMRLCNYPLKRSLLQYGRRVGVTVEFAELTGIQAREGGRLFNLLGHVPRFLRSACERLATMVSQRYMIIHGRADSAKVPSPAPSGGWRRAR